jgi:transposase-like protein
MDKAPATLQEAIIFYSDYVNCHQFMVELRWGTDGPVKCPRCGSENVQYLPNAKVFKCYEKHEKQKFSLKVGTIFEDSPIPLEKWLPVMWLLANSKNGVSSWEVSRSLGVTQKTAWFMLQRGRLAMQDECTGGKIGGEGESVEVDETFIGGKGRNMHKSKLDALKRQGLLTGGPVGKAIVLGALERGGKVRTKVVSDRKKATMQPFVKQNIEAGSEIHSDEFASAWRMDEDYLHQVVNHMEAYVQGNVHTNGIENFWSLLKRGLKGTYVCVEPFHLFRYVDEQAFRFNNRGPMTDSQRFRYLMRKIVGKRLTYRELTGKEDVREEAF